MAAIAYPTKLKASYWYMPFLELGCLCFMLIGLGLWVHYTSIMYNGSSQALNILDIDIASMPSAITQVSNSLVGTSVVFSLSSALIIALGTWKGYLESAQDLTGRLYEHSDWIMFANMGLQCGWGLIMLWLVIMMMGDAVFAAWVYVLKTSMDSTLTVREDLYNNKGFNRTINYNAINAYNCPAICFNALTVGFLVIPDDTKLDPTNCICDPETIQAASDALDGAFAGLSGMITGIYFMFFSGSVLMCNLVGMFVHIRTCMDFNERLLGI